MKNNRGFTLLELLVVVGIIVILVTLGFSSYSTAQKKTRDAKSKADLKDVQNAMEQYYSVCGFSYPTPDAGSGTYFTSVFCANPTIGIIPTVPMDPRGTPYICASGACTSTSYKICTASSLEAETGTYCVSSMQ